MNPFDAETYVGKIEAGAWEEGLPHEEIRQIEDEEFVLRFGDDLFKGTYHQLVEVKANMVVGDVNQGSFLSMMLNR